MSLLIIAKPQAIITIIVQEIICTLAMLLVLKPFTLVLLALKE
jgi:hypothetical protein